ncbi:MAG: hypothetical protein AAF988_06715, partial [Pseudomonadota bacterium]
TKVLLSVNSVFVRPNDPYRKDALTVHSFQSSSQFTVSSFRREIKAGITALWNHLDSDEQFPSLKGEFKFSTCGLVEISDLPDKLNIRLRFRHEAYVKKEDSDLFDKGWYWSSRHYRYIDFSSYPEGASNARFSGDRVLGETMFDAALAQPGKVDSPAFLTHLWHISKVHGVKPSSIEGRKYATAIAAVSNNQAPS